jgi:hypothetical protein
MQQIEGDVVGRVLRRERANGSVASAVAFEQELEVESAFVPDDQLSVEDDFPSPEGSARAASVISGNDSDKLLPRRDTSWTLPSAPRASKARKPSHFGSAAHPVGSRGEAVGAASIGSPGSSITLES